MVDFLSPQVILPELHAVIGAAVVFGLWLLVPASWEIRHLSIRFLGLVVFVWGDFWKEDFWDPTHELNSPLVPWGLVDLGWYGVGILTALFIIWVRFRSFDAP